MGLTDSLEMALALLGRSSRRTLRPYAFAHFPHPLGSDSTPIRRLVEQFHARFGRFACALVSDGFVRNAWMGLGGRPRLRSRS
jgi:hypothetical protein